MATVADPTPLSVLVVEDDLGLADSLRSSLQAEGYRTQHARNLAEAHRLLTHESFDVMILDLSLPDGTGLDLADELRRRGSPIRILILTALDRVDQRVAGLRHGADDYICKPFAMEELLERVRTVLRRSSARLHPHRLCYGDVVLDLLTRTIRRGGLEAVLSARETDLLAYLILRAEQTLEKDRILEEVWGDEKEADSNVLNVYIGYLRNKLEGGGGPRLIHSVRRVGYRLSARPPDEFD